MVKGDQLLNSLLPSPQALILASAQLRAGTGWQWGGVGGEGKGMFGKVVAAERLPWRCCRMLR